MYLTGAAAVRLFMSSSSHEHYAYRFYFGAGPACLPPSVLKQARTALDPHFTEEGSILELSHRSAWFKAYTSFISEQLSALLSLPDEYTILFAPGGGRGQFAAVPLNLFQYSDRAHYCTTGMWSRLAAQEAAKYLPVREYCLETTTDAGLRALLPFESLELKRWSSDWFHLCLNETVDGIAFTQEQLARLPRDICWVGDASSALLATNVPIQNFGIVYAAAQKNLGIAGITVIVLRKALLGKAAPFTPQVWNYTWLMQEASLGQTPPIFPWYVLGLMVRWMQAKGGMEAICAHNLEKATLLYQTLESSRLFKPLVDSAYRSSVNVVFSLPNAALNLAFLEYARKEHGLIGLRGHQQRGGLRASLYSALSKEAVCALISCMYKFEQQYGSTKFVPMV